MTEWLTLMEAAAYCRYRSPSGIRSAVRRGLLARPSRRGGTGDLMFRKHDLDAFLGGTDGGVAQAVGLLDIDRGERRRDLAPEVRRVPRRGPRQDEPGREAPDEAEGAARRSAERREAGQGADARRGRAKGDVRRPDETEAALELVRS